MPNFAHHALPYFDERPAGASIDTIILHSIFDPDKSASSSCSLPTCIALLELHHVSAHYIISRRGKVVRLVDEARRAWHAGVSVMPFADDRRENVNHFSIGIELCAHSNQSFTQAQYKRLAELISRLLSKHCVRNILGHEHIAPGRKTDPGEKFSWEKLKQELVNKGIKIADLRFAV